MVVSNVHEHKINMYLKFKINKICKYAVIYFEIYPWSDMIVGDKHSPYVDTVFTMIKFH